MMPLAHAALNCFPAILPEKQSWNPALWVGFTDFLLSFLAEFYHNLWRSDARLRLCTRALYAYASLLAGEGLVGFN
jgi:hypothetical protein